MGCHNCRLLYTSVVVGDDDHHQELVPLLVIPDYGAEESIAPSCCISPITSASTQSSATLPSIIFEIPVELKETFLSVGGMPRNSPLWVPLTVRRYATLSPSARISSILK